MRIVFAYNLRTDDTEEQAELLRPEDAKRVHDGLEGLGHEVIDLEVSGTGSEIVEGLVEAEPDLVFNLAEGRGSEAGREAFYPAIYEWLGLPYTGGGTSLLFIDLDKRLTERLLKVRGIRVPRGQILRPQDAKLEDDLPYPLIIKPNFEGSSKGITQESIVEDPETAQRRVDELLESYPSGVIAEQFVQGREFTVPMLEAYPSKLLEIVETRFKDESRKYKIYDYGLKQDEGLQYIETFCPPELEPELRGRVMSMADRVFRAMPCPDLGRVDIRLEEESGLPYFLELNPLPSLHPQGSLMLAAKVRGLQLEDVLDRVVRSAARRYRIPMAPTPTPVSPGKKPRPTAREVGLRVGRFAPGPWNAITDVEGIEVGHVTHIEDDVPVEAEDGEITCVRTGITAVVPRTRDLFNNHLVAGGFILNGIGEMSGITQAMEWGWIETPILLSNTMSVGSVHNGIIRYMIERHPELGRKVDVIIPIVGETNDAFLNDVRVMSNTAECAVEAISHASSGPVEQGSVGGGTGMITFDFAGGIGTSSRVLPREEGGYTVGVLVQSNFGKMRNLTVEGGVVGRELDELYPHSGRRGKTYGSIIIVVATDAPLLAQQLTHLSKRAALGLGRVGSYAASTSGEIVFAFSTGNRTSREAKEHSRILNMTFVTDEHVNGLYEAVIEATEEAVLNAIFCSSGMTGRCGRYAPPAPADTMLQIIRGEYRQDVQKTEEPPENTGGETAAE